jgi:hypothetical protein
MTAFRRGIVVACLAAALSSAAGCASGPLLPDHAGVPAQSARSPDLALPLSPADAQALADWMKESEERDLADYAAVKAVLADPAFAGWTLKERMSALVAASGGDWRLAVNDARARDAEAAAFTKSFAVGAGDFVWVVHDRVPQINAGRPTLVVFSKTFVVTEEAR